MRKLVIVSSVGILLVSLCFPVIAKEPGVDAARIEAAKSLMNSMGATNSFESVVGLMGNQIIGMMVKQQPAKEVQIRKIMGAVLEEMVISKDNVIDKVAVIYAREFTVDEMNKVSTFYQTPVGKKMVAKLPVIMKESMTIGQAWGRKLGGDIVRRFNEEAKKQGLKL